MRGVGRWLKTTGEEEAENMEAIDSEEDDSEFVEGAKPRKDKASAKKEKKPRKKKGQEDKGQLRMSFFVNRDIPDTAKKSEETQQPLERQDSLESGTSAPVGSTSFVETEPQIAKSEENESHGDPRIVILDTSSQAVDTEPSFIALDCESQDVAPKASAKRKQDETIEIDTTSECIVDETSNELSPQSIKRPKPDTTQESTTEEPQKESSLMASGRPKRKAVINAEAKSQEIEIVDTPPRRRQRSKASKDDDADCVIIGDKPPKSSTKAKKAVAPTFFMTAAEREAVKRQEAALLEEQRQAEAMLKFQKDLERRKALDVSFFAGHQVNPFFQRANKPVEVIDVENKQDSWQPSSSIVWKKEAAPLFPSVAHINALPTLLESNNSKDGVPAKADFSPLIVSVEDGTIDWNAQRLHRSLHLRLEAAQSDSFWCVGSVDHNQAIEITDEPPQHPWTDLFQHKLDASLLVDQYAPRAARGVVGNRSSVKWLYEWLRAWKLYRDGKSLRRSCEEFHELFQANELSDDDDDEHDPSDDLHRVFVVQGDSGAGKTCSVYACAHELGYEVLEINAGQPRSGKHLIELAGEATQSNRVIQTVQLLDLPPPPKESMKRKKKKSKSKRDDRPLSTTALTLVLLEDVDYLFESDKGFMSALQQMAKHARCPIVLTCADIPDNFPSNLGHVRRTFSRPSLDEFRAYLDAILVDQPSLTANSVLLERVYRLYGGDIRRALHYLQMSGSMPPSSSTPIQWTTLNANESSETSLLPVSCAKDRDLLYSFYVHELQRDFPVSDEAKAQQISQLGDLEAMADSLSLCDVWSSIAKKREDFDAERIDYVAQSVRLQACQRTFQNHEASTLRSDECIQNALDNHLRQTQCSVRRQQLQKCVASTDAAMNPIKGTTIAMQGTGAMLDTMPMMSKIALIDGCSQQLKRRSTSRHGYLNKVVSDIQVVASIQQCTTLAP
ncbi:hypothetical protein AeNC1_000449 [Aphanomyces euteiches]|nr:hypothetical protein AeNC1_000449 [Aphanomyces euteiches]